VIQVHRCIKCGAEFKIDSEDIILKGCPECGSKFFEFHQKGKIKEIQEIKGDSIETIMIKEHGIYEVNLPSLLEDDSIIVSDQEGMYVIDINFLLKKQMKDKKKL
jgi:predicted  nucleic acid-binding Zn-ribbon protein